MLKGIKEGMCWYCKRNKTEAICIYCTKCRNAMARKEIKSVLSNEEHLNITNNGERN